MILVENPSLNHNICDLCDKNLTEPLEYFIHKKNVHKDNIEPAADDAKIEKAKNETTAYVNDFKETNSTNLNHIYSTEYQNKAVHKDMENSPDRAQVERDIPNTKSSFNTPKHIMKQCKVILHDFKKSKCGNRKCFLKNLSKNLRRQERSFIRLNYEKIFHRNIRNSSGIAIDHKSGQYKCNKCSFVSKTRYDVQKHATKEHGIKIQFSCNYCDQKYMDKTALKVHMDSVKGEGGKYRCNICEFKACKGYGLFKHKESEHKIGIKAGSKCKLCGKSRRKMSEHMMTVHQKHRNYKCNYCEKTFDISRNLKQHMEKLHKNVRTKSNNKKKNLSLKVHVPVIIHEKIPESIPVYHGKEKENEIEQVTEISPNENISDQRYCEDINKAGLNAKFDETLFKEIRAQCVKVNEILNNRSRNKEILPEENENESANLDPDRILDHSEINSVSFDPPTQMEEQVKPRSNEKKNKKSYQCDLCFKTFSQKAKLKFHLVKVHKMGNLKLDINQSVNNDILSDNIVSDENIFHKNQNNKMKNLIDQELDPIVEKVDSSHNLVIDQYLCINCGERFKIANDLKIHMENKHTENTINTDIVKDETIIKTEVDDENDFHNDDHNEMKNLTNEELVNQVEKVIMDDSKTNDDKLNLPNLVYLHAGIEKRLPIEKYHYEEFIEFLQDKIFELESDNIEINWYGFGLSRGIIGCQDAVTAKFVKEVASNFEVGGQKFKGWMKNEYGDLTKKYAFTGLLDGKYWQVKDPKESLRLIFKRNKIEEKFLLIEYEKTSKGIQVIFETWGDVPKAIEQKKNLLNAGLSKLKLVPIL